MINKFLIKLRNPANMKSSVGKLTDKMLEKMKVKMNVEIKRKNAMLLKAFIMFLAIENSFNVQQMLL